MLGYQFVSFSDFAVRFLNYSDSVVFLNYSDSVVFLNYSDGVVILNYSDSVVFLNYSDSVVFLVFAFHYIAIHIFVYQQYIYIIYDIWFRTH